MNRKLYNLDGNGLKWTNVYVLPVVNNTDYWVNVTDIPCPLNCSGIIRWHEAGYVSGYRICDKCKKHFLAKGNINEPILLRVGTRRG